MLKKLAELIDVKSIITIGLVITLLAVTLLNIPVEEKVFNLFSNVLTMVMTYFFTKKSNDTTK